MLRFNTLLREAGLDPAQVQLLRHKDQGPGWTTFSLWCAERTRFEAYQTVQGRSIFSVGKHVASFVVDPAGDTIFVGLYQVRASRRPYPMERDPFNSASVLSERGWLYDLARVESLSDFEGRLVIDWGGGYLAWVQRAERQNKPVLELRRQFEDPEFPGFNNLALNTDQIAQVYPSWLNALAAVGGIYLLVCRETGEQYVGSAYGEGGFWGRWLSYADGAHGGNKLLMARGRRVYDISVLQIVDSKATDTEVIQLEAMWKNKLGSRAHGLNAN